MQDTMSQVRPDKDRVLAAELVAGATQEEAARAAGMGVRTAQRRMADPGFRALLDQLRDETVRAVADALKQAAVGSVETLIALQDEQYPPAVRARSAIGVLDQLTRYQRSAEFDDRLRALETAKQSEYIAEVR
jgi:uncharacterized protein (UPF0147 family)